MRKKLIWDYIQDLKKIFYTSDRFFQMISFNNFEEETFLKMMYDYSVIQDETAGHFTLDELQIEFLLYEYKESTVITQLLLEDLATIEAVSVDGELVYNLCYEGEKKFDRLMF